MRRPQIRKVAAAINAPALPCPALPCPAEPLRKHTGPYHNGQCSPGFAISLSAPDTTKADKVLAIAKRATSGDTVAPLSRTCTQMDSVSGERHAD